MSWFLLVYFIIDNKISLKWVPPPPPAREQQADEQIAVDLGDEYEQALSAASQEEIIDLAGN